MSSSSEDEDIVVPVKRIKRRRVFTDADLSYPTEIVNLYSHKVLPKLDALVKSPVKMTEDNDDEGNDFLPSSPSPKEPIPTKGLRRAPIKQTKSIYSPERCKNTSADSTPVKVVPPTPPPPFNPLRKGNRGSRKAKKLLNEVSSVLSKVSNVEAINESIATDEVIDCTVSKEIMVKVRLKGKMQRYPVDEEHTLNEVFERLAKKAKVEKARLLVTLGDRRIFPSDTPASIQLSIADILECVVAYRRLAPNIKDNIKLQMQGPFDRKKVTFTMGKEQPLREIMQEYADKNKTDIENLQFLFDGETLNPECSPNSLDLDNGDCIDVMRRK